MQYVTCSPKRLPKRLGGLDANMASNPPASLRPRPRRCAGSHRRGHRGGQPWVVADHPVTPSASRARIPLQLVDGPDEELPCLPALTARRDQSPVRHQSARRRSRAVQCVPKCRSGRARRVAVLDRGGGQRPAATANGHGQRPRPTARATAPASPETTNPVAGAATDPVGSMLTRASSRCRRQAGPNSSTPSSIDPKRSARTSSR
jgi:hypothetical protein